jgi:hypothetical protein
MRSHRGDPKGDEAVIKISELPEFQGKRLLLEAQTRGARVAGGLDATTITLIGLANLLIEQHIFAEDALAIPNYRRITPLPGVRQALSLLEILLRTHVPKDTPDWDKWQEAIAILKKVL